MRSIQPTISEAFKRVLKDDGFVIITCPDLQALGERIAKGELETPMYVSPAGPIAPLDTLYGLRRSIAQGNLYMAHHTGFTLKTLGQACARAGFGTVIGFRRPNKYDLWVLAAKPKLDESKTQELAKTYLIPLS
jgi:hypothetical protein